MITHDVGIKMNAIFSIPATETKFSFGCASNGTLVNFQGSFSFTCNNCSSV
jgi:hypothetical protein